MEEPAAAAQQIAWVTDTDRSKERGVRWCPNLRTLPRSWCVSWCSRWALWILLLSLLKVVVPNAVSAGAESEAIKWFSECMEQTHALPMPKIGFDVIPIDCIDTDVKPSRSPLVTLYFIWSCAKGRGFTRNRFMRRKNADFGAFLPDSRDRTIVIGDPYLRESFKVNAKSTANVFKVHGSRQAILLVQLGRQLSVLLEHGALNTEHLPANPILICESFLRHLPLSTSEKSIDNTGQCYNHGESGNYLIAANAVLEAVPAKTIRSIMRSSSAWGSSSARAVRVSAPSG